MSPTVQKQLTLLRTGATGYIGGDALYAVYNKFPDFEYAALVRNSDIGAKVAAEYPKIRLVYGTLEDSDVLEAESARADIVIRRFSLDHTSISTLDLLLRSCTCRHGRFLRPRRSSKCH